MAECLDVDEENWIKDRIAAVEALIIRIEEAQVAVAGGATSYSIDTGQTRQTVTKSSPSELKNSMEAALNLRATLRAQLQGRAVNLRPGW